MMKIYFVLLALCALSIEANYVDYTGYKVLTITPNRKSDVDVLYKLRKDYSLDLWNEPRQLGAPVMTHLRPDLISPVEQTLRKYNVQFDVAFADLQSAIASERLQNAPTKDRRAQSFEFGRYNVYEMIVPLLQSLPKSYPTIAKLETIGNTYENRPIYSMKISAGTGVKPVVLIECGIHAREWTSVAACVYFVNRLITNYTSDPKVKSLVDRYEFHIVVEANPDGYVYTWTHDRLWRKTRSRSNIDWLGNCRGADANRNFDIEHCGVGTSRKPCDDIYCGDKPFSESESRAIRDLIIRYANRTRAYFSVHAYSQYWMTPYGTSKRLPPNYRDLERIGIIGAQALGQKYGTLFKVGSISNIIYEAAGSSVDYAYVKHNISFAYALELRDNGRFGFILPNHMILPACEETYDGIVAALNAL